VRREPFEDEARARTAPLFRTPFRSLRPVRLLDDFRETLQFGKILDKALAGASRMPVLAHNEREALAAVAKNDGSIAIVKRGTPLPAGVALLEITD
jgi:hypothetical protein